VEARRRHAASNKAVYDQHLKWPSIKRSLEVNAFADALALEQLETHFRFLSAFTHPNTDTRGLLYGRNEWSVPCYDHYTSELCLLYVAVLASWEFRNVIAMSKRTPTVGIADEQDLHELQHSLEQSSGHFWFVGQKPSAYDRFQARNKAAWKQHRTVGWGERIPIPDLNDEEVGYYSDPLQRLVNLHGSTQELSTGLVYQSPWPRDDARFR
jgi:hypothetical protein